METKKAESTCPLCGYPTKAGHAPDCPVQIQRKENDQFLAETIYANDPFSTAGKMNKERMGKFDKTWREQWQDRGHGKEVFSSHETNSPFEKYSSRGWKIHVSFEKGREREMAFLLFASGLYFKVEAGSGTSFNGLVESGATIYIGAHDTMEKIVEYIEKNVGPILRPSMGSAGNILVSPKIKARFDVQKTLYGMAGSKKYSEYGMPWPALGGIPQLRKYDAFVNAAMDTWSQKTDDEKKQTYAELQRIYEESKNEAIKDFGEEFLMGSKTS